MNITLASQHQFWPKMVNDAVGSEDSRIYAREAVDHEYVLSADAQDGYRELRFREIVAISDRVAAMDIKVFADASRKRQVEKDAAMTVIQNLFPRLDRLQAGLIAMRTNMKADSEGAVFTTWPVGLDTQFVDAPGGTLAWSKALIEKISSEQKVIVKNYLTDVTAAITEKLQQNDRDQLPAERESQSVDGFVKWLNERATGEQFFALTKSYKELKSLEAGLDSKPAIELVDPTSSAKKPRGAPNKMKWALAGVGICLLAAVIYNYRKLGVVGEKLADVSNING